MRKNENIHESKAKTYFWGHVSILTVLFYLSYISNIKKKLYYFKDMMKKSTKIKINIESKSMDDMTRKIRIEQELENQPEYIIRLQDLVLEAVPSLPGLEIKILEVNEEGGGTNVRFKSAHVDHAEKVLMFLRRTSPIDVMISLR